VSTEYRLAETQEAQLSVLEHSNIFDIYMSAVDLEELDDVFINIPDLTLAQLREIHRKLGEVISYFED
jgi:hypothetical protein